MKKVLVITYYWPPSAGAGVQRWLKFSKYLRETGWEPIIYTPENPEYPGYDASLEKDVPEGIQVIRRPIREPYRLYKIFTGRHPEEKVQAGFLNEKRKPGLAESLAVWLRGNLFIPDARKWWINPSVRFLSKWLRQHPVDAIVSTGPPHSMHLIALGVTRRLSIPWLADFRDPWTQIDFYHHLKLSQWADRRHKRLEKQVLSKADAVVTVSPHCAKGLEDLSDRKIEVITNGFDPEDFAGLEPYAYESFSITHLGSMNADRNPENLWKVLGELVRKEEFFSKHLRIRLIGKTDIRVMESLERHQLTKNVENLQYLPHDEAIRQASQSAILLLPLNNTPTVMGIAPGKLYEYLALKRPILCIGPPQGDAAAIIRATGSGVTFDFNEEESFRQIMVQWAAGFDHQMLEVDASSIEPWSRPALTRKMVSLLDQIAGPLRKETAQG